MTSQGYSFFLKKDQDPRGLLVSNLARQLEDLDGQQT